MSELASACKSAFDAAIAGLRRDFPSFYNHTIATCLYLHVSDVGVSVPLDMLRRVQTNQIRQVAARGTYGHLTDQVVDELETLAVEMVVHLARSTHMTDNDEELQAEYDAKSERYKALTTKFFEDGLSDEEHEEWEDLDRWLDEVEPELYPEMYDG